MRTRQSRKVGSDKPGSFNSNQNFLFKTLVPKDSQDNSFFYKNNHVKKSKNELARALRAQKNKKQLYKLFRPINIQVYNLEKLQKSELMYKNNMFQFLVKSLKNQKNQSQTKDQNLSSKIVKPLQIKIRQFIFTSLEEAVLMSQQQLKQRKFIQHIFQWFVGTIKKNQIALSFKTENDKILNDEEWNVRSHFKSNMPLEINQYQRKLFNMDKSTNEKENKQNQDKRLNSLSSKKHLEPIESSHTGENKLFKSKQYNNKKYTKVLPLLQRKNFYDTVSNFRQTRQQEQMQKYQNEYKNDKSRYQQHTSTKFYKKKNLTDTLFKKFTVLKDNSQNRSYNHQQDRTTNNQQKRLYNCQSNRSFNGLQSTYRDLSPKVIQKIQAVRFGVTLTDFRKLKQNPKQKQKYQATHLSPLFHPNLTSTSFITKSKLSKSKNFNSTFEGFNALNKTKENMRDEIQIQDKEDKQNQIYSQQTQHLENKLELSSIDAIGLLSDPFYKAKTKTKKK